VYDQILRVVLLKLLSIWLILICLDLYRRVLRTLDICFIFRETLLLVGR
jgi:hypothetical protein